MSIVQGVGRQKDEQGMVPGLELPAGSVGEDHSIHNWTLQTKEVSAK